MSADIESLSCRELLATHCRGTGGSAKSVARLLTGFVLALAAAGLLPAAAAEPEEKEDAAVPELIAPKGQVLFEEKFTDLAAWRHEGGGVMKLDEKEPGTLRLECVGSKQGGAGAHAFCLKDFPDGVAVEYDLKVLTRNGLVIAFLAMKGSKGEDMFDPALPARTGVFGDYVRSERLVSYHVSVSRYDDKGAHTGESNWRRNPGLNMMKSGEDLCKEIGRWYKIRLVKDGGHCQLGVDGRLAHEFTDPGELKSPLPAGGKVGFRAIGSEVRALFRNFKVTALR